MTVVRSSRATSTARSRAWREPERGEWTSVSAIGSITCAEPDEPTADYEPAKASTVAAAPSEPTQQAASHDHDELRARKERARAPLAELSGYQLRQDDLVDRIVADVASGNRTDVVLDPD